MSELITVFHGTSSSNQRAIEQEGFMGSELHSPDISENTNYEYIMEGGVVYVTDSRELAEEYGDHVVEIEIYKDLVRFFRECPVTDLNEFYVTLQDMKDYGVIVN